MKFNRLKQKSNKIALTLCCVLFAFFIYITGGTLSKYIINNNQRDIVELAIMSSNQEVSVDLPINISPNETIEIPFVVTNKDKIGNVSEVSQEYTIQVNNIENNLPLTWKLYSNDQEVLYTNNFNANEFEIHEYCLKVTWPSQYNNPDLSFEIDILEIQVVTEQLD